MPDRSSLFSDYVNSLIRYKAIRLSENKGFDDQQIEDLEQELRRCLLEKEHLYLASRASWDTFANRVIHTAALNLIRNRQLLKRGGGEKPRPLLGEIALPATMDETVDRNELHSLIAQLPADLRAVCHALMISKNKLRAAASLGITRQQLDRRIEKIRTHFNASGFGDC